MTKIIILSILLILVISTSITKNSTKGIDDEIYTVKENLLFLENRLSDTKLDFDYLSSSEKLLIYQKLYFETSLKKKSIQKLKILDISNNKVKISDLIFSDKNE